MTTAIYQHFPIFSIIARTLISSTIISISFISRVTVVRGLPFRVSLRKIHIRFPIFPWQDFCPNQNHLVSLPRQIKIQDL